MTLHTSRRGAWRSAGTILSALITAVTLIGCHGARSGGGAGLGGYIELDGSLSGLVGSGLVLQNGQINIAINGPGTIRPVGNSLLWVGTRAGDVTVATQPTNPSQTCVVANGTGTTGGLGSSVTNITVTCTTNPPRFVYVANRGSNNVSAYTVDAGNGTLAPIAGSPFAAGNLPVAIAVDPTGTYAYVANQMDATISAFTIDRASGALMSVNGSPFPTGPAPSSVAIDSFSSFVYVTNGAAGTVSAYTINAGGALTAVTGSPFATGATTSEVPVDPALPCMSM